MTVYENKSPKYTQKIGILTVWNFVWLKFEYFSQYRVNTLDVDEFVSIV